MQRIAPPNAITIAFLRPIRSDIPPKQIPPTIAPIWLIAVIHPSAAGRLSNRQSFLRNVGYRSCVPWLDELNAAISTVRNSSSFQFFRIVPNNSPQFAERDVSHTSDSLIPIRTKSARSAGNPPMKNRIRHAPNSGNSRNKNGYSSAYASDASRNPNEYPSCNSPDSNPRYFGETFSSIKLAPTPHSPPIPIPNKNRSTMNVK